MEDLDLNKLLYGVSQGHNVNLPSGTVATIREMTGHDQRKFMNKTSLATGAGINDLLANCTESIDGEALPADPKARNTMMLELLAGDRQALLFAIRKYSLGDDFMFTMECPNCKKRESWEVNLNDQAFEMHSAPLGKEKYLEYDSEVKPGVHVRVRLLDGYGEMDALKKSNTADTLTDLEIRLPQVQNGQGNYTGIKLNAVPDRFIGELRKKLRENEGRLDTRVTITCKNCLDPITFDLLQVPDFMIPNVIY